ncbi:Glycosyltransferase 2-like, partial [Klenkia terrae]
VPETDAPLVTVAIPTFRRPDWLRQAIDSARAQTVRDVEILVSDSDGSPEIEDLVADYGDPRLRYRSNEGPTDGLQNALAMYRDCRGRFVATLHDDDFWDPTYLEVMLAPLQAQDDILLSFADHWVVDAEGRVLPAETEATTAERGRSRLAAGRIQPFVRECMVDRAVFFVVATVFRNGAMDWDDVPAEVSPPYEVWLTWLASRDGAAAWYVPDRLSYYRLHGASAAHSTRLEVPQVHTFDRVLADPRLGDLRPEVLRASAPFRASLAWSLLVEGDPADARRQLRDAWAAGARGAVVLGLAVSVLPRRLRAGLVTRIRAVRAHRRLTHRPTEQESAP